MNMAKIILKLGYILKPYLFNKFKIKIIGNEIYSNNNLIGISPIPETSAIARCMSNFKLVQILLR